MRSVAGQEKPFKQKFFLSSRRQQQHQQQQSNNLRGIHINISSDPFQHRIPPYIQRLWQESRLRNHLSLSKRRWTKRYQQAGLIELIFIAVCVSAGCIVLLVHVGFFSGKKYQDWQQEHYHRDPPVLDEVDLLDKVYPDEGRSQTTAVIVLKKNQNQQAADSILERLCQYDMFSKFIVWNDDPAVNMTIAMIQAQGCTPNRIQVMNAPIQMGSSARYRACRLSKTPFCYFQDIPRKSQQLRSTYANFLRSPNLIHGESTDHEAFVNSQWRYCFSNKGLQLHTCFIDIQSGTFVAKAMVSKFMQNYDSSSVVDEFADMYFMMYINQVPYQLEGSENGLTVAKELTETETEHMDLGLTILYHDLEEGQGIVPLEPYLESTFDRNARASCNDDRCLFLTNKQLFPSIDLFSYTPSVYVDVLKQMHDDYMSGSHDAYRYSNAVDNQDATSWKSIQTIRAGDYIGLDMLMPMRTSLMYRFLVNHPYNYKSSLIIQVSYDGLLWIKLHPSPSVHCQTIEDPASSDNSNGGELLECRFVVTDTGYRYIRLESQKDLDFAFDVYDVSFSAKVKKDANGQLLDIALNEDGIVFIEDNLN